MSTPIGARTPSWTDVSSQEESAVKVSTQELKERVLSPNEPSVNIERIVRQARSEKHKKLFQIFSRKGVKEIPVASMARLEERLRMLKVLERECLDLGGTIEHLSEKQELLATLKESKMSLQTVALEKLQEKVLKERGQKKHWSYRDVRTSWENWKMKGIGQGCYKGWSCQ